MDPGGMFRDSLTLTVNGIPGAEPKGSPLSGGSKVKGDAEIGMRMKPNSLGKREMSISIFFKTSTIAYRGPLLFCLFVCL